MRFGEAADALSLEPDPSLLQTVDARRRHNAQQVLRAASSIITSPVPSHTDAHPDPTLPTVPSAEAREARVPQGQAPCGTQGPGPGFRARPSVSGGNEALVPSPQQAVGGASAAVPGQGAIHVARLARPSADAAVKHDPPEAPGGRHADRIPEDPLQRGFPETAADLAGGAREEPQGQRARVGGRESGSEAGRRVRYAEGDGSTLRLPDVEVPASAFSPEPQGSGRTTNKPRDDSLHSALKVAVEDLWHHSISLPRRYPPTRPSLRFACTYPVLSSPQTLPCKNNVVSCLFS